MEVQVVLGKVVDRVVAFGLDFDVVKIQVHGTRDVAGERPRSCGPDEEVFLSFRRAGGGSLRVQRRGRTGGLTPTARQVAFDRKPHEHAFMRRQLATFGDLHLAVRAAAAARPRHDVVSLIDFAAFEAFLQELPDRFVVFRAEREIAAAPFRIAEFFNQLMSLRGFCFSAWRRDCDFFVGAEIFSQIAKLLRIIPVHPIAKTLRLFGLARRELEDSAFTFIDEVTDAVFMNGGFRAESQLLFHFDFDPQALTVETVLVSLIVAGHCEEALIGVLVRAAPGVVHSHWVIRGNRAVEKTPAFAARVFSSQLLKSLLGFPEFQDGMFAGNEIAVSNGLKHENMKPKSAM